MMMKTMTMTTTTTTITAKTAGVDKISDPLFTLILDGKVQITSLILGWGPCIIILLATFTAINQALPLVYFGNSNNHDNDDTNKDNKNWIDDNNREYYDNDNYYSPQGRVFAVDPHWGNAPANTSFYQLHCCQITFIFNAFKCDRHFKSGFAKFSFLASINPHTV